MSIAFPALIVLLLLLPGILLRFSYRRGFFDRSPVTLGSVRDEIGPGIVRGLFIHLGVPVMLEVAETGLHALVRRQRLDLRYNVPCLERVVHDFLLLAEVVLADFVTGGNFVVAAPSMLLVAAATQAAYSIIARKETWGHRFLLDLAVGQLKGVVGSTSTGAEKLASLRATFTTSFSCNKPALRHSSVGYIAVAAYVHQTHEARTPQPITIRAAQPLLASEFVQEAGHPACASNGNVWLKA